MELSVGSPTDSDEDDCTIKIDRTIYKQWKQIREENCFTSDNHNAAFLIQHFRMSVGVPSSLCLQCNKPLMEYCAQCKLFPKALNSTHSFKNESTALSPANDQCLNLSHLDTDLCNTKTSLGKVAFQSPALESLLSPEHKPKADVKNDTHLAKDSRKDVNHTEYASSKQVSDVKSETYDCNTCLAKFSKYEVLKQHRLSHKKQKSHTCLNCGTVYASKNGLNWHVKSGTCGSDSKCPEQFKSPGSLGTEKEMKKKDRKDRNHFKSNLKRYICDMCGHAFRFPSNLARHVRVHTGEKPFACQQCGAAFAQNFLLENHMASHMETKWYKCDVCCKVFASKEALKVHQIIHSELTSKEALHVHEIVHSELKLKTDSDALDRTDSNSDTVVPTNTGELQRCLEPCDRLQREVTGSSNGACYKCMTCTASFSSALEWLSHMGTHSNHKNYKCADCCLEFSSLVDWKMHGIQVHGDNQMHQNCYHLPNSLPSSLQNRDRLLTHICSTNNAGHSSPPPPPLSDLDSSDRLPVVECTTSILQTELQSTNVFTQQLFNPSATHLVESKLIQQYVCTHCKKKFEMASQFIMHIKQHVKKKVHECHQCHEVLFSLDSFIAHFEVHTSSVDYKCHQCEHMQPSFRDLIVHIQSHVITFSCQQCLKVFPNKVRLDQHKCKKHHKHQSKESKLCQICGALLDAKYVSEHMKIHSGDQPFKCTICPAKFRTSNNLQGHMRTHTGHKPYLCQICGSAFSSSSNLKRHAANHAGLKSYICRFCNKAFADPSNLGRHTKLHLRNSL